MGRSTLRPQVTTRTLRVIPIGRSARVSVHTLVGPVLTLLAALLLVAHRPAPAAARTAPVWGDAPGTPATPLLSAVALTPGSIVREARRIGGSTGGLLLASSRAVSEHACIFSGAFRQSLDGRAADAFVCGYDATAPPQLLS